MGRIGIITYIFLCFYSFSGFSTDFYWISNSNSNFSSPNNWSLISGGSAGTEIPGSDDIIHFDNTASGNCLLDQNIYTKGIIASSFPGTISMGSYNIHLHGPANLSYISSGTGTIIIYGGSSISGTATHNNIEFIYNDQAINISGELIVNTQLTIGGTGASELLGSGILRIKGDLNILNTTPGVGGGDVVIFVDGIGDQHFYGSSVKNAGMLPGMIMFKFMGNLYMHDHLTFRGTVFGAPLGNIVTSNSHIVLNNYYPIGLTLAGSLFSFNDIEFETEDQFQFNVPSGQGINATGNLVINPNVTLNMGTSPLVVSGNLINNGTLLASNSDVTFNGTTPQNIFSSSGGHAYKSLSMNNASGVSLNTAVVINESLTLNNGIIKCPSVTINSSGAIVGGSPSSFIDASLTVGVTSGEILPIGNMGMFSPVKAEGFTGFATLTAQYFHQQQNMNEVTDDSLASLSNCEYWLVTESTGNVGLKLKLHQSGSACNGSELSSLRVASLENAIWTNQGGSFDTTDNSITSGLMIPSGYITIGEIGNCNPNGMANFTATPYCNEQTNTFVLEYTGNASSGALFSWSFNNDAFTGMNPGVVSFDNAGVNSISLTVDDNGCGETSVGQIEVTAATNLISSYAILATDKILIGKNSSISSGAIGTTGKKGKVILSNSSVENDWVNTKKLYLNKSSYVNDVYANHIKGKKHHKQHGHKKGRHDDKHQNGKHCDHHDVTINGDINEYLKNTPTLPDFPNFNPGNDLTIFSDTIRLSSGVYGKVIIKSKGVLILEGGEYELSELIGLGNTTILYTSNTTLKVNSRLAFGKKSIVAPINDQSEMHVYFNHHHVSFGDKSEIDMHLMAPKASVVLHKNSTYTGTIIGRNIILSHSVSVENKPTCWPTFNNNLLSRNAKPEINDADEDLNEIDLPEKEFQINIYPNPTSSGYTYAEIDNLTESNLTLEVMDLSGKLIRPIVQIPALELQTVTIETAELPKGIYLVRLTGSAKQTVKRVVIL